MALLIQRRTVYLHIPKTGGIWLTGILHASGVRLRKVEAKHATYDLVLGRLRAQARLRFWRRWTDYRAFCVVRHPLTWYESWFRYQQARAFRDYGDVGSVPLWHPMAPLNGITASDFNAFMAQVNARVPGFAGHLFRSYTVNSGARVLKAETLRDDLAQLNRDWGLGLDDGRITGAQAANVSPPVPILWHPRILAQTIAHERAAFALYGYDPEGAVRTG